MLRESTKRTINIILVVITIIGMVAGYLFKGAAPVDTSFNGPTSDPSVTEPTAPPSQQGPSNPPPSQ